MSNLDFIRKLYRGKNCYSDHMSAEELQLLHIHSNVEEIVVSLLMQGRIIFLTGNPGDGKTFLIRMLADRLSQLDAYVQMDMNEIENSAGVAEELVKCYEEGRAAVVAVNEYPFLHLQRQIRQLAPEMYEEISSVKQHSIVYDIPHRDIKKIAVIDLNERNLLDRDHTLAEQIILRLRELLREDTYKSRQLEYNITALSEPQIRRQLVALIDLASMSFEHFSVRDIFGAIAFALTACETEEFSGLLYYDAIFAGTNALLQAIQLYDPIYLSNPSIDEALWNGDIRQGWCMGCPERWPASPELDEAVDEASELFKSIKRKYYFENLKGAELQRLQPSEIEKCIDMFVKLDTRRKAIKERIVHSLNKLFLSSSEDRKQLRIWTTHRYDLSIEASTAVSSQYIDTSELDIQMPRPADWLKGLEYTPRHLVLKPKGKEAPCLVMDVDFLRTLNAVEEGYPVNLLAPRYTQTAALFLQQLCESGQTEENEDGEIIIASRKRGFKRSLYIRDFKYGFEEDE